MSRGIQVVFDAADPAALAEFWVEALGYITQPPPPDYASWEEWAVEAGIPKENWNDAAALVDPDESGPRLFIQRVPERKTAKNRMHLDITVSGGRDTPAQVRQDRIEAESRRLAGLGGTIVRSVDQRDEFWIVMQDPEGNEFCLH